MTRSPWQIQKSVIFALFIRELKTRFGSYKGGYIWFLIDPLAQVVAMSLVFTFIGARSKSGMDFPVFLVTGVVPFLLFKNIALHVMDGVSANRALFTFRQVKPIDTFIARAMLDGFLSASIFAILLMGMTWVGLDVPFRNPIPVIFVFLLLIPYGLGMGMIFCVITHYMPESKTFIRLSMLPLYMLSGIFFPVASLPKEYHFYLLWNPALHAIEILRSAFFGNYPVVSGVSLLYFLIATLALLFIGLSWYRTKRYELAATT